MWRLKRIQLFDNVFSLVPLSIGMSSFYAPKGNISFVLLKVILQIQLIIIRNQISSVAEE